MDTCGNTTVIAEHSSQTVQVNIFPNPASDIVSFKFENGADRTLSVTDELGREIWRKESNESNIEFPASKFAMGIYYYSILQNRAPAAYGKLLIVR